ncbi:MAG: DUF6498-containing protein [Marinirhabdus sp.]|nr:DUF6498-containing protein [Marinirhabdus sp.]
MTLIKKIIRIQNENMLIYAQTLFFVLLLVFGYVSPETIVFGYFFETIIIGLFHMVKLYLTIAHGQPDVSKSNSIQGYGMILFFMVHYGMFVAIQMVFVFSFFAESVPGLTMGFNLVTNFTAVFRLEGMSIMIASLFITNLGYFYTNFWKNQSYTTYAPSEIFFSPYVRIVIQQFVVIFAGFCMVLLHAGLAAAYLLLLFRLAVDLCMVAMRKDSNVLDQMANVLSNSGQSPAEIREQLRRFSE